MHLVNAGGSGIGLRGRQKGWLGSVAGPRTLIFWVVGIGMFLNRRPPFQTERLDGEGTGELPPAKPPFQKFRTIRL